MPSLRLKVALAFSGATIVLLLAQALGVRALAEAQEERLLDAVIADDMAAQLRNWAANPAALPPVDPALGLRFSQDGGARLRPPAALAGLADGVHEVVLDGRELHVAVARLGKERVLRLYDFSMLEHRFKDAIGMLMAGTGGFALLTIWLGFALSGLLVRQVAGLARQVRALRTGSTDAINPGRYDEREVVELADTVNDYHRRMADMVERERAFTGNVSHELRTPLTAIRTSCELLEQDPGLSAKSRTRLGQIESAAAGMQAMAESLLALARAQPAGAAEPVALAAAIRTALERCAARPGVSALAVTVDVPETLRVRAHGHALAIVLSNLIENAAAHARAGQLRFLVENGALVVADDGAGIAPDALAQVFTRFYQAPGGAHGHGIGLAMVGAICAHYGWTVGIASAPGAGTRVSLALPGLAEPETLHENFTNA